MSNRHHLESRQVLMQDFPKDRNLNMRLRNLGGNLNKLRTTLSQSCLTESNAFSKSIATVKAEGTCRMTESMVWIAVSMFKL